jgi:predicted dehydrogenase
MFYYQEIKMDTVRFGLIGLGGMARNHAKRFIEKQITDGVITAVAEPVEDGKKWAKENISEAVKCFDSAEELIDSGKADAVLIATPHYAHPPLTIKALEKGLHVLCEKPAGVHTKHVKEMNDAAAKSDKVFGLMFNQRTRPVYQKMHDLVQNGELGELVRTNLIITDWFRTQSYYDNGGWRGTWKGEGGGVLLNQCPHNLDLWQWICGMPKKLMAFCQLGKHHNIEVEDDVTCYVEYPNGAAGVFVASTGEAPGTNRFEIIGDRGKLLLENGELTFWRAESSISEYCKSAEKGFGTPDTWKCEIPASATSNEHGDIINDFIKAIKTGSKLLAPGEDGIKSLQLSNGMLLSSWTKSWVEIPFDDEKYYKLLQEKIKNSTYKKPEAKTKTMEVAGTF